VTQRPSGKASGSEGGREGARMSYLTFDSGAGIVSATARLTGRAWLEGMGALGRPTAAGR